MLCYAVVALSVCLYLLLNPSPVSSSISISELAMRSFHTAYISCEGLLLMCVTSHAALFEYLSAQHHISAQHETCSEISCHHVYISGRTLTSARHWQHRSS